MSFGSKITKTWGGKLKLVYLRKKYMKVFKKRKQNSCVSTKRSPKGV